MSILVSSALAKVLHSALVGEEKKKKRANKHEFFYKMPWMMAELQDIAG